MSSVQIEERLSKLEAEVDQLKRALLNSATPAKPWWEEIIGIFADDPAFEEAMEIG
jgi:tetrahydromethanopterin S-methyltransferase subunit B